MSDIGMVYPPRDAWDVAAYPTDDCVAGYRDHRIDEPIPGGNHAPGYRWGWVNSRKDATGIPDGFEGIRSAYFDLERSKS